MYDYTHCISDSLEGITHSLCDLSFEDHRPLYDWVLNELSMNVHPQQIEFSRLNLQYTLMSKRKIKQLINHEIVDDWDDPRLPTIAGLRRRGYTPESIRDFCRRIGVTKSDNNVELAVLESCIRNHLDRDAPRVMGVIRPLKIVIENYPEDRTEMLEAPNHPKHETFDFSEFDIFCFYDVHTMSTHHKTVGNHLYDSQATSARREQKIPISEFSTKISESQKPLSWRVFDL